MENKKEEKIVFSIYFYIYDGMLKSNKSEFSRREIRAFFHRWNLPKWIQPVVIQEMENLGLISQENKQRIVINKDLVNPLDNKSELYSKVGLWSEED